ncbi:MAG: ferrous iron transport protein B [Chitinophagaceae bacterium]|nr:ferrous iron transport protein B [Chitinophagaceae bacterium]
MSTKHINIVLTGNPNSGKSSLFNALTGLKQQVGNFPGVTVDKKTGEIDIEEYAAQLIDLPGTYSLYPRRSDEWVAYKVLMGLDKEIKPDLILVAIDASNLKRNLLFCSQIMDLKIPVVAALTMTDIATAKKIGVDINGLQLQLGIPIVEVNPRKNRGLAKLKKIIAQTIQLNNQPSRADFIPIKNLAPKAIELVQEKHNINDYHALHFLINHKELDIDPIYKKELEQIEVSAHFNSSKTQAEEVIQRYHKIRQIVKLFVTEPSPLEKKIFTDRLDNILLHKFWGYLILTAVLFFLFQSVFWLAQFPMDGIEWFFKEMSTSLNNFLPNNKLSSLLVNGLLAGLSGILVFVPQIAILFGLITILEDTGYMARIGFLSDRFMRKAGLNGKSVMPMISGFACAVPAIMAARNIENKKERLLTILITPLMSCSARLPVFTILIAMVIPNVYYFGFLSLQGLVMMGLYLLGIVMALLMSYIFKAFIKIKEKSFFILELPVYRAPRWHNILVTMFEKAKIFVVDAGKVIMIISLLLWFLSTYGPSDGIKTTEVKYAAAIQQNPEQTLELNKKLSTEKLEHSYAGYLGKAIEPIIQPLGYDWKIGIALITSFAAREVFVGTMATLYSVEDSNDSGLRDKLKAAKHKDGSLVYTLPAALSLMVFYVLAMQCMSTLAVVKRETKTWKWPIIQLIYMTGLAYVLSFITYQLFK